ncbi:hypothetical protein LCGC14_1500900 [marine sediment metagenome]|uniref:Uncharacterized protein n=1 Tax=marine sediment metagenome TaxID=412755 RepID=A0A0F9J444_9ZZZZ
MNRSGMDYFIPAPWKTQDMIEQDRPLIAKAKAGGKIAARILMVKYGVRVWTEEELGEYGVSAQSLTCVQGVENVPGSHEV